jgi:site-specific DNA recombinase
MRDSLGPSYATALYGRTSQDDPKRVTIEIQQKALTEWAGRDAMVARVVGEFWDDGVSGTVPLAERPAGRRLFEMARAGKVQAVAVVYADRFGRSLLEGLQAVKALEDLGVKLVAISDGWDARRHDSPLYFQFRIMLAEEEHRRIKARMQAGKERAMARDNAPPGGPLTFGYRLDTQGRFVIDPAEGPVVIRLFEMALRGESHLKMLAWCRDSGVAPGRKFQKRVPGAEVTVDRRHSAARWHATKVGKILRNPTYAGRRTWAGRSFPCPALVDQDTFDRVQLWLAGKDARRAPRGDLSKGWLSGLLTCECGRPFYQWTNKIRGKVYHRYACASVRDEARCGAKILSAPAVDEKVWCRIKSYLADPAEFARRMISAAGRADDNVAGLEGERAEREAQIEALDREVSAVWAEQERNGWPLSWVTGKLQQLAAKRGRLVEAAAELGRLIAAAKGQANGAAEALAAVARARASLGRRREPTPELKREVARIVLAMARVETRGEGRAKKANLTLHLLWGDESPVELRQRPKECIFGREGNNATILSVIYI